MNESMVLENVNGNIDDLGVTKRIDFEGNKTSAQVNDDKWSC